MDDFSKLDGWFSVCLGAFLAFVAALKSFFSLKNRVDVNERDIGVLKNEHEYRLQTIEKQIASVRTEVRQDIKEVAEQAERRHDTLESLLRVVVSKVN